MKKILFLLLVAILTACGNGNKAPEVTRTTSAGYELTQTETTDDSNVENVDYPAGLFDKPMPEEKTKSLIGSPVMEKRATWNAALTALKQALPMPDEKIIFDYSKIDRQVNNENECLFTGDFQAKNAEAEYSDMFFNIRVVFQGGNPSDPHNWKAQATVVE